jgi:hypothetical protein
MTWSVMYDSIRLRVLLYVHVVDWNSQSESSLEEDSSESSRWSSSEATVMLAAWCSRDDDGRSLFLSPPSEVDLAESPRGR